MQRTKYAPSSNRKVFVNLPFTALTHIRPVGMTLARIGLRFPRNGTGSMLLRGASTKMRQFLGATCLSNIENDLKLGEAR